MTLGMLMGALWAKEAWGHYWSWDPKETWAAITWLSYWSMSTIVSIVLALFVQPYGYSLLPSSYCRCAGGASIICRQHKA